MDPILYPLGITIIDPHGQAFVCLYLIQFGREFATCKSHFPVFFRRALPYPKLDSLPSNLQLGVCCWAVGAYFLLNAMASHGGIHFKRATSLNFTVFIGLEATIFICLIFGPFVVSTNSERLSHQATVDALEYISIIIMIMIVLTAIRYIRQKEKFHRDQTVFWPTRCLGCAHVLNPERKLQSSQHENQDGASDSESKGGLVLNSLHLPRETLRYQGQFSISISGETNQGAEDGKCLPSENRAIIKVFSVFCFICCTGLILETVHNVMCYAIGEYSRSSVIAYSTKNFVIICTLPTLLVFWDIFTDAVFVNSYKHLLTAAVVLSLSIWQCLARMIHPIAALLRLRYDENVTVNTHCGLNNTFGHFFRNIDTILSPIYTETSIIMLGISLQLWNSFVSKISITRETTKANHEIIRICEPHFSFKCVKQIILKAKIYSTRIVNYFRCTRRRYMYEPLLSEFERSLLPFSKSLTIAWTLFISANLLYLGYSLYLIFPSSDIQVYDSFQETSILLSTDMLFSLFFCALCTYEHLREKEIRRRSGIKFDNPVSNLRSHETMLLICCIGIFCQCIFLVTAAVGILMNSQVIDRQEHISCVIGIVYSAVKILMMWQMTVFLIGIPRREFEGEFHHARRKWVLICLINVMVVCGVQWIITSLTTNPFQLQRHYFGDVAGDAIWILLEPFGTLYGLHAAMMAYELYKYILTKTYCTRRDRNVPNCRLLPTFDMTL